MGDDGPDANRFIEYFASRLPTIERGARSTKSICDWAGQPGESLGARHLRELDRKPSSGFCRPVATAVKRKTVGRPKGTLKF